jgi:glutamyl endopeptidase
MAVDTGFGSANDEALVIATGLDASISNSPEVAGPVQTREEAAEEGSAEGAAEPYADRENVVGYEARESASTLARVLPEVVEEELNFPDCAHASFGKVNAGLPTAFIESIIDGDDRVRITATSTYPWRVHASLLITAADGSNWIGTGWFIGPRTLITAGHCVYIKHSGVVGRDGFARSIKVMPGRNGTVLPFGAVTSTDFRTVQGWANNGDQNYDYGAIILPSDLGNTTGWLGFGVYDDATLLNSVGNISGYPGDKPAGTQWYHSRKLISVGPRKVYYDIDTMGGQSGSAVYRIVNGRRTAVAVHAYGGSANSGTRITAPVHANMVSWKA